MSEEKKVLAQIQGGFCPQNPPLMKGAHMSEDKKVDIRKGYVPPGPPKKPEPPEKKGFVPPPPPRKPPEKPDKGKK